jgi:phytoene desaturase
MNQSPKAIIIGAGVAGLASAIRLAVQGFEVAVYEKNPNPGGKLHDFEKDGYRFDAGPSLFTQPENIEELFALAGEPIKEYLTYSSLPVSCNYFYEDGTVIHAFADKVAFAKELSDKNGETEKSVFSYLQLSAKIYKRIGHIFLNFSLHKASTLRKAPLWKAITASRWSYLFHSLHKTNHTHFKNHKTVQLFNRYATYNGSDPYKAPGMLRLISHLEHNEGTFYPKGGMISITNALYRLALKKGVQFYFNSPVQRIIQNRKKVSGVVVNDENIDSDIIVSNMDVYFTHKHLLRDSAKSKKILQQERSSSAMIFYWGIQKEFPELGLHNILFSDNYKEEFDYLFRLKKIYDDPTIYINITSKCEPGLQAPKGKENWFVMINVPANIGQDWELYRKKARMAVIEKINRILNTDVEAFIETETIADPVSIESATASYMGSLYGTSSNSKMAAFFRHPNFSNTNKGLYFVGGSVHPGGGIPLCLKSAKIMSGMVTMDMNKLKKQH